jgi:Na+-transporting methylmalonyl-CoA/oxaloacetate decarboxylase gamma subunit
MTKTGKTIVMTFLTLNIYIINCMEFLTEKCPTTGKMKRQAQDPLKDALGKYFSPKDEIRQKEKSRIVQKLQLCNL